MKHGRTDFRDLVAVAVDPADALERDDAYSVAEKDGEHWILVHIADATRCFSPPRSFFRCPR